MWRKIRLLFTMILSGSQQKRMEAAIEALDEDQSDEARIKPIPPIDFDELNQEQLATIIEQRHGVRLFSQMSQEEFMRRYPGLNP